ncbi:hypothetical protein DFS33DRAFT_1270077 [Desarmillaria ectypa]|nr:hypothetical protein DFS33DRAFT_1270077 [Desarmillaria ectypa]
MFWGGHQKEAQELPKRRRCTYDKRREVVLFQRQLEYSPKHPFFRMAAARLASGYNLLDISVLIQERLPSHCGLGPRGRCVWLPWRIRLRNSTTYYLKTQTFASVGRPREIALDDTAKRLSILVQLWSLTALYTQHLLLSILGGPRVRIGPVLEGSERATLQHLAHITWAATVHFRSHSSLTPAPETMSRIIHLSNGYLRDGGSTEGVSPYYFTPLAMILLVVEKERWHGDLDV